MLKGIVALVTGGASGLGKATVERFVKNGAKVVICDLPSSDGHNVAKELGPNAVFSKCDVSSEKDVKAALYLCEEEFKYMNVLVNCAGIGIAERVFDMRRGVSHSLESFIKVQQVNLFGTFNTIRLASKFMYKNEPDDDDQRGVIINTASIAAYDGQIGQIAYAASKGGIVSMTLPVARDLAQAGIRNVTIAPGLFETPLLASLPEKARANLVANVPFPKRLGRPEEYASLVESIVLNKMINGETIRIDGSLRMH